MASEGVIKIKGDVGEFIKALDETQRKMVEVGKGADKAHGHAKSFGDAWEHANRHLERSLFHGLAIAQAFKAVAAAAKEFQDRAKHASEEVGGQALTRDAAAARLGISSEKAEALVGGAGAASAQERTQFFSALAQAHSGPGKRRLTEAQIAKAQTLKNSGLFSDEEIEQGIQFNRLDQMSVGARLESLGEKGYAEYQTRREETEKGEAANEARYKKGFGVRIADARINARNAAHPVGEAIQTVAGTATDALGGKDFITVGDRIVNGVKETNDLLNRPPPPTVAPGAH